MSPIGSITVSPQTAAQAYGRTESGAGAPAGADFGAVMSRALGQAVATGQNADAQAATALAGGGNVTDVVTAVAQANLTLQTAVALRDRVVQAYQTIMNMPI